MTNDTPILTDDRGRARILTLNRPGALNALNDTMYDALHDALQEAEQAPKVSVVVITGLGRAFTAGQDLGELADRPQYKDGLPHGFPPFLDRLQSFPKPVIAAVNGLAVGIGVTMLPHCDLVLVAESARLRAPFTSLGVTAEAGSTYLLPAMIGWMKTAHLLYTAGWVSGPEAVELGLAWRCVPDDELMNATLEVAEQIGANPVTSLMATKRLLVAARLDAVNRARKRENEEFAQLLGGPANLEAIAAFREKRVPDFSEIVCERE